MGIWNLDQAGLGPVGIKSASFDGNRPFFNFHKAPEYERED
jgi:hypothetical protein